MRSIATIAAAFLLSACVSTPRDGTGKYHQYFGFVRIFYPDSRGKLIAIDVKTLGIGFDGAAFIGWRESKFVYAKAEDCRTVIILRDKLEVPHVVRILQALGERGCVADFSGSFPPQ
ncbi:hypothetical protein [Sandarakinorhabdus limnophila]|uniref:hypothetical protein n=1 Tax=Sandarakinorhabdus limnophila TaxID=210512 RepID=UPI0026EEA532|nr:hypothetical protein [Sandarakinorhabdus limnophila]MCM0031887.1 hypothetical protein [Sandarakinorhabdus limnophila]